MKPGTLLCLVYVLLTLDSAVVAEVGDTESPSSILTVRLDSSNSRTYKQDKLLPNYLQ